MKIKLSDVLVAIAIPVILTISSCKKDDNSNTSSTTNNQTPVEDTSMVAKVDGTGWEANTLVAYNNPSNTLSLIGIELSSGTKITLNYLGSFQTGTVNLGVDLNVEYRNAAGTPYGGINGSITFTKFNVTDKVVSGTFTCTVKDNNANITKVITEGKFSNLSY